MVANITTKIVNTANKSKKGCCHSSLVSSAPTILRPWVQILCTFFNCIIGVVMRKGRK